MPKSNPKPCAKPGCNRLTAARHCELHTSSVKHNWEDDSIRGNRHQRGYGTAWNKLRKRILRRDNHLCKVCLLAGKAKQANEVDHIVPKALRGGDDDDNLQAICTTCHRAKTARERRYYTVGEG